MSWDMHPEEYESVINLSADKRYRYSIKKIADWEVLWGLNSDEGWALAGDDEGHEVFPVWPHPTYAERCATGSWSGCTPKSIDLDGWLEKWLPDLETDHALVTVLPTPDRNNGVVIAPARMRDDLLNEMAQYEDLGDLESRSGNV